MRKLVLFVGFVLFVLFGFAQAPANDECGASQTLTRQVGNTCGSTFAANTTNATPSTQTAIYPTFKDDDIWFSITLATGQTEAKIAINNINVTGTNNGIIFELWTSDCATRLSYSYSTDGFANGSNATWSLTGLTSATTYKVRAYTNNTTSRATFDICFLAGPVNDDCNGATILTPVAGVNTCTFTPGVPDGSTLQATSSSQAAGDASGKDDDIWFQFTTASTPKSYRVDLSNVAFSPAGGSVVIELWQLCTDATYVSWFPSTTTANLGTLPANTIYKLRIYSSGTSSRISFINICISYVTPPPANDIFTGATLVSTSNNYTCTGIVTGGTTVGATPDNIPTCVGAPSLNTANDVWYKFVASTSQATFKLTNKTLVSGASNLMWMQMYESSNTNLKLCGDNNTSDSLLFDGSSAARTLSIGTTYYLRLYNHDPASACTFNICNYVPQGPSYDDCALAANLLVSTNEFCNNKLSLTNVNATTSAVATPPCASNTYTDVWVRFTAPNPLPTTGLAFSIQNFSLVTGSNPNLRYAVYGGSCGGLAYLSCDALPTLTAGSTYYIRIFSASGSGTGNFDVCLSPNPTTLTNTNCLNAVTLVASTDQSATYTQGTTYGLTTLNTITDCFGFSGSPNKVLWYKFVATATTHFIQFKDMVNLDANANSLGFRVTTGTCAANVPLSTPVCVFGVVNQNQTITGLTIGQTYFVELMENTFNGGAVSYKLRVIGTGAPANDEAAGSITLTQNPTCTEEDGSFRFSTLSAAAPASLGATYYQDVWYRFQAATTTATIALSGRLQMPRIAIYNATGTIVVDAGAEAYNYTVSGLTVGTFYTIRVLNTSNSSGVGQMADFKICISGVPSTTLATGPTPSTCLTNDNTVTSTNSHVWLHFTRGGNLIASVLDDATMGSMVAKYYINAGAVRSNAGIEYMDRNLEITPTTQPTSPVRVRLYFTKAEFDAFLAANDGDGNDAYWLNDLKIAKFTSLSCQSVISGSGEALYGLAGFGNLSASVYYLEVTVPSFSSFYFKNVPAGTPVPVSCANFSYKLDKNNVQLLWSTLTEVNSDHFVVERSTDGLNFTAIATIAASVNSSTTKNYSINTTVSTNNIYYYIIKQIDKDGKEQFVCKVLKINSATATELFSKAYPNPANNTILVDILQPYTGNVDVQITNALGQVVQKQSFTITATSAQLKVNISKLVSGVYNLSIISNKTVTTQQINKL